MTATLESPADIPSAIFTQNGTSITIYTENCDEEYTNPIFSITPPTSTPNQTSGPQSTWIINLLRITQQFVIRGYIESTDRDALRTMFKTGNLKDNPLTLSWDNLDSGAIPGIMEKLVLHRTGAEEQAEWSVDITFTRGSVR